MGGEEDIPETANVGEKGFGPQGVVVEGLPKELERGREHDHTLVYK